MDDTLSLSRLTAADFKLHLNTEFTLILDDSSAVSLMLASVRDFPGAQGHRDGFSLNFTGASDASLPQRMYRFTHPTMAPMEIFIVPIAANPETTTYEAIFA